MSVAVVDAVKLLEGGLAPRCQAIWLITCARKKSAAG